ncbi:MAG: glycosyltransferase family 39 protein [Deltaproteobacteria bacterium]|nr:glycosyltransferase family 39 protein [Deltaproteobacteria bacterium]
MALSPRRLAVLLTAFGVLAVLAALRLPPIQDETYYWAWSRQLEWSYLDHPPAIAAILAASTALFGDGPLGLRAASLLAIGVVLALSASSARRLAGGRSSAGYLAILVLLGAPMFVVGYVPGTHDPIQGAAAALGAYAVIRALEPGAARRWSFLAGFVLTAAVLIKHSSALLAAGALLGAAGTARGRVLLARPAPWLGAALGALVLAPWLASELTANGGSIRFQAQHVFASRPSRGVVAVPLTLGSMILTLGPLTAIAILIAPLSALSARIDAAASALGAGALLLLAACLVAVWSGSGEANWPMPALVFVLPALAAEVVDRPRVLPALATQATLTAVIGLVLLLHAAFDLLPLPSLKDPLQRGAGFDRVAARAEAQAEHHGARLVVTRRYQIASLLRYHLRDRWPVLELGSPRGRPSQYDRWGRPAICPGEVVVVVSPDPSPPAELSLVPLEEPVPVERSQGAERWWVRAFRATAAFGSSCGIAEVRS